MLLRYKNIIYGFIITIFILIGHSIICENESPIYNDEELLLPLTTYCLGQQHVMLCHTDDNNVFYLKESYDDDTHCLIEEYQKATITIEHWLKVVKPKSLSIFCAG